MDLVGALAVTAAVLGAAAVTGILLTRARGRARPADGLRLGPGALPGLDVLAPGATLVHFSTEHCAVCPSTRRLLRTFAEGRDEVGVVEVDLTRRVDLARELRILTTPTVFVLDADGTVRTRFAGAPRSDALASAVAAASGRTERSSP